MDEDWQQSGFGIYIHWPFCESKCPYCDFNSHVSGNVDQRQWAKALVSELERYNLLLPHRAVNSVFFGGGTPSLMTPELIETLLMCISETFGFTRGAEITLEANPSSVEAGKFQDFRGAGINRVSLGIQALNDQDLKYLGRMHSAAEARRALDIAQTTFPRTSFDLIYARQHQTLQSWEAELTEALSIGTEHLSLYQLTIEDGTVFGRRHAEGKLPGLPQDDLAADMYSLTQDMCNTAGLPAYEVSNHARPYAESQHNLIYWRYGDYIGIGPGAHGRLTLNGIKHATETKLFPDQWLKDAQSGNAEASRVRLTGKECGTEYMLMSLRLLEGCDLSRVAGFDPSLVNISKIKDLVEMDMLSQTGDILKATPAGRPVLNAILRDLLND